MLEAFKWDTVPAWLRSPDDTSTRPAEFWEALAKVAPNLQHLSLDFYTHELNRMKERGISVRGQIFESLLLLVTNALLSFSSSFLQHFLS
jgi:hypothetical protein